MKLCLSNMYVRGYVCFNIVKRMHFDTSLSVSELCPPEDTQTKVDGGRVKGIYLSVYLKIFVDSFLSCNINHPISKLLKDFGFSSFVDFCKITSRYILAKAKMIRFASMNCEESCQRSRRLSRLLNCPNIITRSWFQHVKCFTYLLPSYFSWQLHQKLFEAGTLQVERIYIFRCSSNEWFAYWLQM